MAIQEELPQLTDEDETTPEEATEERPPEKKENPTPKMIPPQNVSVSSECLSTPANEILSKNLKNLAKSKNVT